tara:strand:+ start:978 stop:2108 length:1131 start_codon:yes stop_codon:yes gene_type:complete
LLKSKKLKIIFLSDASSIHTIRWVESLSSNEFEIKLFSLFKPEKSLIEKYKKFNVNIISPDLRSNIKDLREPNLSKIKYLQAIPLLKKTIKDFRPDILHAHYASSYGILGYLSRFKPFILSVWGSDVYHFPYKNILNKWLLKLVIKNCDKVCSTSIAMKKIIEKEYKRYDTEVISFGVDLNLFKPRFNCQEFNVGTIKSIENYNGIDCLIDAAKLVIKDYNKDIFFQIVGEGSLKKEMQQKAKDLDIEDKIKFVGFVKHKNVIKYYNNLSIFVAVSKRESFGVSILEAASCQIPSITSNIGGLTEVNINNETGIVIEPNNPKKLADTIVELFEKKELRLKLGKNARKRVEKKFNWKNNVNEMIRIYKNIVNENEIK